MKMMKMKLKKTKYDPWQVKTGTKVEMEHTSNKKLAEKIAKDHLDEFPDYYTHLLKMEAKLKRRK